MDWDFVGLLLSPDFWMALPTLVWAVGAACVFGLWAGKTVTIAAALVAALCAGVLTFRWRRGSRLSRDILLLGFVLSLAAGAVFVMKAPPP